MDAFYFFLIAISAVGLIAVIILVFGFSIMYRKEKNPGRHADRRLHSARGHVDHHSAWRCS